MLYESCTGYVAPYAASGDNYMSYLKCPIMPLHLFGSPYIQTIATEVTI